MYTLTIHHPVTGLLMGKAITHLTEKEMEIRRELAERGGFKTKVCKD